MHARPIFQIHWKLSSRTPLAVQIIQLLSVLIAEVMFMLFTFVCHKLRTVLNILKIAFPIPLFSSFLFSFSLFMLSGLIPEAGAGRAMVLCDSCVMPKESGPSQTQNSESCALAKDSDHSQTQNTDSCVLPKEFGPCQTQNSDSCALPKESSLSQTQNNDATHG